MSATPPMPNQIRFEAVLADFSPEDWEAAEGDVLQLAQNRLGFTGIEIVEAEGE